MTVTLCATTALLTVIVLSITIRQVYKLQKQHIIKDKQINDLRKEVNKWLDYNTGIVGDLAFLIDGNNEEAKMMVKRKWKTYFKARKELAKEQAGLNTPQAKN